MNSNNSSTSFYIVAVIVLLLFTGLGYVLGKQSMVNNKTNNADNASMGTTTSSFFDSQNASVRGKIVKVSGRMVTVVNSKNQTQDFEVITPLLITKYSGAIPAVSQASDLSTIEPGKEVFLNFSFAQGKLKLSSIGYPIPIQTRPSLALPGINPSTLPTRAPQSQ